MITKQDYIKSRKNILRQGLTLLDMLDNILANTGAGDKNNTRFNFILNLDMLLNNIMLCTEFETKQEQMIIKEQDLQDLRYKADKYNDSVIFFNTLYLPILMGLSPALQEDLNRALYKMMIAFTECKLSEWQNGA